MTLPHPRPDPDRPDLAPAELVAHGAVEMRLGSAHGVSVVQANIPAFAAESFEDHVGVQRSGMAAAAFDFHVFPMTGKVVHGFDGASRHLRLLERKRNAGQ